MNAKAKTHEERIANCNVVLEHLRKLTYPKATTEDLVAGDEESVLDLIWRMFCIFQLKRPGLTPSQASGETIQWLASLSIVALDVTSNFQKNAKLLISLVNTLRPHLIPPRMITRDTKKNAATAMQSANQHLGALRLLAH